MDERESRGAVTGSRMAGVVRGTETRLKEAWWWPTKWGRKDVPSREITRHHPRVLFGISSHPVN